MIGIMNDAFNRAYPNALGLFVMTNALRAESRIDFIDAFTLGNRPIRAFGLTNITIDAFIRYEERHIDLRGTLEDGDISGLAH